MNNPDHDWEIFGKTDPYFAVLTAPEFHGRLSGEARAKFFESGEKHIAEMFAIIREHLDPAFAPARALDFGCGVGRLLLPLAERCAEVVGVDISPSMLAEARENCASANKGFVTLVQGNDELSGVRGSFDFVHSYIVLQHIPVTRGERLVGRLAGMLAAGGVGMFHVTYDSGVARRWDRFRYWARVHAPGANWIINLARGRPVRTPVMQMNRYSVTSLLNLLRDAGCHEVHVRFSDHGGARGVLLFARKSDAPIFG